MLKLYCFNTCGKLFVFWEALDMSSDVSFPALISTNYSCLATMVMTIVCNHILLLAF